MSSVGFSYAHVHVQQDRLKEKLRRSKQDQERGKDAAQQERNKRSNKTKKIHPTLNSEKNSGEKTGPI
nr:hypothetical protein LSAT_5X41060 [Ipomoea trifida]GMC94695.1 hypothetical protein LSAT_5X41060 [Ipomoea batatas]